MIRIGLTRWFVTAVRKPVGCGRLLFLLRLTPQAKTYLVAGHIEGVPDDMMSRKEISLQACEAKETALAYDFARPETEIMLWRTLANSIASETVNKCLVEGLVFPMGFNKMDAEYGVFGALLRAVENGESDEDQQVDIIDLVPDIQTMREEHRAREAERRRIEEEAEHVHREERARHRRLALDKPGSEAALELLRSYLNDQEKKELDVKGSVTVRNFMGDFVVPVSVHGLIKQYVDGKPSAEYCVVFKDWELPVGDEALMKILLLKSNPEKLIKTASRRRPRRQVA